MAVKTVQVIVNGVTTTLTYNSTTKKYEATITAPATSSYNVNDGHYYPVTVKATDQAGNVTTKTDQDATLGSNLRLRVKEKVAPIITITSPTASARLANNKPQITFTVTDADSGVNPDTIKITIGSTVITSGITKTATANGKGFACTYTPATALPDGSNTIKVDASDNDGNAAAQKTVTFVVDTVPPTLSVSAPTDSLITNQAACTVTGVTNDATSSPCTVTIKLNSGAAQNVTVNADGTFSKELTLVSGTNTITVVSTDGAGRSSTVTRTVTLDQVAPTIRSITLTPNPVETGKTCIISVEVVD